MNLSQARTNLINNQLKPWGSLNRKTNQTLMKIPREFFVPEHYKNFAFADMEIALTPQAKMLYPKIEGRLLDALAIQKTDSVLEIGTGSGYLTACLSVLAKSVLTFDVDKNLVNLAKKKLDKLKLSNINFEVKDCSANINVNDFFDIVVVSASVYKINNNLLHLLAIDGRMFVVEGINNIMQAKLITRKSSVKWDTKVLFETKLDTMIGLAVPKQFIF